MNRDFNSDFSVERRIIRLALALEVIVVLVSTAIVLYSNRGGMQWIVLAGLLGMLIGLVSVGSYLWMRYVSQSEVEEKGHLKGELVEHKEKIAQAKSQIGRLEEERKIIDLDEQNLLAGRNQQRRERMTEITDGRHQAEITYRQSLQNGLRHLQSTHIRDGLLAEKLSDANLPSLSPEWVQTLAANQITSANDVMPEWLGQAGLEVSQINVLLAWRAGLEAEYQATQPVELPVSEVEQIAQEYKKRVTQLEKDEIVTKAALEKDVFEIRDHASKQRDRNKNALAAARSALRGLDEKQTALEKQIAGYHQIHFRRYFGLALGSAVGLSKNNSRLGTGVIPLLILGLLFFQGAVSIRAARAIMVDLTPPAPPVIPPPSELACIPTGTLRQTGLVSRVVDGDTIDVQIEGVDVRVRYIGMDVPEPDEYFGGLSMNRNIQLVAGQQVTLVKDVSETDSFDRLLRYVLVGEMFVNYQLVVEGYARASAFPPDTACQMVLEAAQDIARASQVRLWSSAATPAPSESITPSAGSETASCSCAENTLNCADFSTQVEGQACYDTCVAQGAGDIHYLDGNEDGMACEALP